MGDPHDRRFFPGPFCAIVDPIGLHNHTGRPCAAHGVTKAQTLPRALPPPASDGWVLIRRKAPSS